MQLWGIVAMTLTMSSKMFKHVYFPRNTVQQKYIDVLLTPSIPLVIVDGPAGTGKTALACQTALECLYKRRIQKIILTRPVVAADEGIGFLKGGLNQKMDPWIAPMLDVFTEFYSIDKIRHLFDTKIIEIAPFSFMRGRTFKESFIIADEAQNTTPSQLRLLTTRIGNGSKMVLTGDLAQSDVRGINGLQDLIDRIHHNLTPHEMYTRGIARISFDAIHIERHPLLVTLDELYTEL
jgi:phosphate starvation-inducible PhoH-like protein